MPNCNPEAGLKGKGETGEAYNLPSESLPPRKGMIFVTQVQQVSTNVKDSPH